MVYIFHQVSDPMKTKSISSHPVGVGLALMTSVLGALYFFRVFKPAVKKHLLKEPDRATIAFERLARLRRANRIR